jgi:hydrogenase expression/formation protein HypD
MRYLTEFRDAAAARALAAQIRAEVSADRRYHIMEFCGGHTHAIFRHGIHDVLPENVRLVHGPGCPVCVLPIARLDHAIELCARPDVILCSYGDMLRVPASRKRSLLRCREAGNDVRMVYSAAESIALAEQYPDRQVVFFAIGFETTTPPTAVIIKQARALGLQNFSVFCNHVLTPSAIQSVLDSPEVRELGQVKVDGFIGPSHVSTIIGSRPYEFFAEEYQRPVVISGFEPLDVLQSILMLVRQMNRREARVENQFSRGVTYEGNLKAQGLVAEVFELRRHFEWRGLGLVAYSGLRIKSEFAEFDAEHRFDVQTRPVRENKACACGAIIRGVKQPTDCKIFGSVCTPRNPIGSCMVSSEGACAAYYRFRKRAQSQETVEA